MGKVYVLDTNVLLHDPHAIFAFQEHDVVLPAVTLEEVDGKKRDMDEVGRNARYVARLLDAMRMQGKLHEGVKLPEGGRLYVELNHRSMTRILDTFGVTSNDNRLLSVALNLQREEEEKREVERRQVILVSKDALVRIKADVLGLAVEDYRSDRLVYDREHYSGYTKRLVAEEEIDRLYRERSLPAQWEEGEEIYPHQFVFLRDAGGSSKSALVKVSADGRTMRLLRHENARVWGISPRNAMQKMAFELLMDEELPLVTITGRAGTGKTLISLAIGLQKTEEENLYRKLLITRPIIPVGKDLGFLPGEKEEKLRPWMQPFYDNLEYLFSGRSGRYLDGILSGMKSIQVEALTYIRGRSIPEQFIIIDEAQNLTKHEVKTILSRVGEKSKIVMMGDPEQIDHPYLDASNNGLTYVVEKFKRESLSGHIRLEKGERSILAQKATELL